MESQGSTFGSYILFLCDTSALTTSAAFWVRFDVHEHVDDEIAGRSSTESGQKPRQSRPREFLPSAHF